MRLPIWTICDRCGFKYARQQMRRESGGVVVCFRCYDGEFDRQRHPQNFAARPKREPRAVPGGRPNLVVPAPFLLTESEQPLLAETGVALIASPKQWTPFDSLGY